MTGRAQFLAERPDVAENPRDANATGTPRPEGKRTE
jgi:hypothetical protein